MTPLDRIRDALDAHECRPRLSGDQIDALCPAHDDRRPSLSVRFERQSGRLLVNCHTGCATEDVVAALGMTMADLFEEKATADRPVDEWEVTATYPYTDATGAVLYRKVRTAGKHFWIERPNERGGWVKGVGDQPRVPFRLPQVLAAARARQSLIWTEGEKDTLAAERLGLVATCNRDGAAKPGQRSKVRREDVEPLRGATGVIVVADRDEPGVAHAKSVVAALASVGVPAKVMLPAVERDKADLSDHIAAGLGIVDLVALDPPPTSGETQDRRLKVTRASDVPMRRLRWLWDLRIVLGGLTLLAGREGIGKSTVAAWLCAAVTRGELAGELAGEPRPVVYINSEDARDYTIVPRLKAAKADLDRVMFLDAVMPGEDGEDIESAIVLPRDAALIAELVEQHKAALVVLDAATSTIDSRLDGDRDRQMRQGLEAIGRVIGERTGAAIVGIVHFGKRESNDTGKLILGSIAWSQVARSVLAVALDEEASHLVISRTKGNLGIEPPSLAARIISAAVETDEGATWVGRCHIVGETDQDARVLLAANDLDPEDRTERDQAAEWLKDYLTATTRVPSKEVKRDARKAGFSERTLARARASLKIVVAAEGFPRESYWSLPDDDPAPAGSGASRASDANNPVGARGGGTTGPLGTTVADLRKRCDCGSSECQSCQSGQSCHPHVHGADSGTTDTEQLPA